MKSLPWLLSIFLVLSACSTTDTRDLPSRTETATVSRTATVTGLDPATRLIVLKDQDGKSFSIIATEEVRNFNQLRIGDKVETTYTAALAIAVEPASSGPDISVAAIESRARLGDKPGGVIGATSQVRSVVDAIDYQARTISLRDANGYTSTYAVPDTVKKFNNIKTGDEVVVEMTQALAIKVSPQ